MTAGTSPGGDRDWSGGDPRAAGWPGWRDAVKVAVPSQRSEQSRPSILRGRGQVEVSGSVSNQQQAWVPGNGRVEGEREVCVSS